MQVCMEIPAEPHTWPRKVGTLSDGSWQNACYPTDVFILKQLLFCNFCSRSGAPVEEMDGVLHEICRMEECLTPDELRYIGEKNCITSDRVSSPRAPKRWPDVLGTLQDGAQPDDPSWSVNYKSCLPAIILYVNPSSACTLMRGSMLEYYDRDCYKSRTRGQKIRSAAA